MDTRTVLAPRRLRDALRHLMVAHGALEEARRPCGTPLSIPHAYALLELWQHTGPLTVSELAQRLSIDRSNVSRWCARMEQAGEVTREPHPEDGRAVSLRLTAQGRKVAESVDASSAQHFETLAQRLGPELGDVVSALHALTRAMQAQKDEI